MVQAHAVSESGPVRKNNEDSCAIEQDLQLFVVADGVGGHSAGEVASRLAVEALVGFVRRSTEDNDITWPYGIDPDLSIDGNRLRTAINLANRRVFRASESHDDYTGMGSTLVGAIVAGSRLSVGSVGDSRLYLLSAGRLSQLTVDDTWAATVLGSNGGDPEVARHPMRHVLTNVLGTREQAVVHMLERELAPGDVLLLCSDGLHGVADDAVLEEVLREEASAEAAAARLVRLALDRGTRDNVTALVVRYEGDA
jgi:protein phosphatase